jgi:hydroxypyruvate isomerase
MSQQPLWNRRTLLRSVGAGVAVGSLLSDLHAADKPKGNGRIKQSICRWCYGKMPLSQLAAVALKIGYQSIELLGPKEFLEIKPTGLTCAMMRCRSIPDGLNRKENHSWIEKELREHIEFAAAHGIPNVICMSGNRRGMAEDEGLKTCAEGLKRVLGLAEEKKVTICMELLNSRVDHKDYMCDRTPWGVALVKKVGSPRFKLLYDIYHMQIMEGDVIRTIRTNAPYIGHFHTGGVPGRHELDDSQELNWHAIARAIADTGFTGYIAHEFVPTGDPLVSLHQAVQICTV